MYQIFLEISYLKKLYLWKHYQSLLIYWLSKNEIKSANIIQPWKFCVNKHFLKCVHPG